MPNITNHQGNANQSYCETLPHTHQDGMCKKNKQTENNKCWSGCGEIETIVHVWWDQCRHYGKVWWFLKKLKIQLSCDPEILKSVCTHMFIAALFTIAKTWTQSIYPLIDIWSVSTTGSYEQCCCDHACVCTFLVSVFSFLEYICRSGRVGLYDNSMLNF